MRFLRRSAGPPPPQRFLIVNADDFGADEARNRGIAEAHRAGIVKSVSILANAPATEDALRIAREIPGLQAGVHLDLTGWAPLVRPIAGAFLGKEATRAAASRDRIDLRAAEEEWCAQVERVIDGGILPVHLDAHHHVFLYGRLPGLAARIAQRFRIPCIRCPREIPTPRGSESLVALAATAHAIWRAEGLRMTDHFRGLGTCGRLNAEALHGILRSLPEGTTELMVHPGRASGPVAALEGDPRAEELGALTAPATRTVLREAGVCLADWNHPALA